MTDGETDRGPRCFQRAHCRIECIVAAFLAVRTTIVVLQQHDPEYCPGTRSFEIRVHKIAFDT